MARLTPLSVAKPIKEQKQSICEEEQRRLEGLAQDTCLDFLEETYPLVVGVLKDIEEAYQLGWITPQIHNEARFDPAHDTVAVKCGVVISGGVKHQETGFLRKFIPKVLDLQWLELVISPDGEDLFFCVDQEYVRDYSDVVASFRLTEYQVRELAQLIADVTGKNVTFCDSVLGCKAFHKKVCHSKQIQRITPQQTQESG